MQDSEATPDDPHRPAGHPDQKSTIAERLTGAHDARDPDGLLTVEQDADRPDASGFGHAETDTLEREQEHFAQARARSRDRELPHPPRVDGVTGLDTTTPPPS